MRAFLDYSNWRNGRIEQDISVKMNDPQSQDLVMEYKVNKAKLLSEAVVSKTMDETVLNISFEGYEVDDLSPFFSQYVNINNANDVIYRDQWLSLSSADQANYKEVYADSATPISSLAESRHAAVNINRR